MVFLQLIGFWFAPAVQRQSRGESIGVFGLFFGIQQHVQRSVQDGVSSRHYSLILTAIIKSKIGALAALGGMSMNSGGFVRQQSETNGKGRRAIHDVVFSFCGMCMVPKILFRIIDTK